MIKLVLILSSWQWCNYIKIIYNNENNSNDDNDNKQSMLFA